MNELKIKKLVYFGSLILLTCISFTIFYFIFIKQQESNIKLNSDNYDTLSEQTYYKPSTVEINPYVPDFVGFNYIAESGVSEFDASYIYDFLTNFTLYEKDLQNPKISYVKDSFTRGDMSYDGYVQYSFKFGINDGDIHTLKVRSSWVDEKISLSIVNKDQAGIYQKDFTGKYLQPKM